MNKILITILLALVAMTGQAKEKNDSLYLYGTVADGFTKAAVEKAFVTLMREDSTVVDTMRVYMWHSWSSGVGRSAGSSRYYFRVSRQPANYIIMVEHENYETACLPYAMKQVSRRRHDVDGPTFYLKKAARARHFEGGELGEVVVKATKVKMVYRGDTIVYNADAFNVPEGSMLDGLIRQLPGVELNDDGEIFVNGKKVENLTLNGADFFKGKNQIMLQNLPYFTVKNVEVYKKQTPENKYLGIDDEDKKELTMDVILKREYSIGGSANVEAGYGTDDRYRLKGFGMRYTDRTRALLFGGMNNINETMEYNAERSQYNDRTQQSGDRHFRQVGGQFVYLGPEDKVNNSTEVSAQWTDDFTETRRQSETYMSDASTFGQSQGTGRSKPSRFGLKNTLRVSNSKFHSYSHATLDYRRQHSESDGWSLTTADALMRDSINSSWYRSHSNNETLTANVHSDLSKRLATGDAIRIGVSGSYYRSFSPLTESLNHYDYHRLGTTDDRDRQTRSPYHTYQLRVNVGYSYRLTEHLDIEPSLSLGTSSNKSNRHEYLRDSIDYQFDQQNSYEQLTRTLDRRANLSVSFNRSTKTWYIGLYGNLNFNFQRQAMDYESLPLTTSLKRHYTLFSPNVYLFLLKNDRSRELNFGYDLNPSTPSVTDLIDRPITSDPLNIYLGNPGLKMQQDHNWWLTYEMRRDSIDQRIRLRADANITHNSRTQGYTYDMTTGIRIYRPENIASGNWNASLTVNYDRALGKKKFFHTGSELTLRYNKSTGLALTTGSISQELSRVGNFFTRFKTNLGYQRQQLTLRIKGEVNYRNIDRNITIGQQPTDIWDFSYGLSGAYKLPWNFTLDTDLTMNSHRGYADQEMNDNRLYWDAAITKSLANGRWVIKLRGYDLLGQVSSLRYSINAQGRTETWTNSMRRYAMLTASYRFTQKPKKLLCLQTKIPSS